jgi:hypothetical protein
MDLSAHHLNGQDITLQELHTILQERAKFFRDEQVESNDLRLDRIKDRPTLIRRSLLNLLDDPLIPDIEKSGLNAYYPMQQHAVHLFCSRLKVPYKFFMRCWNFRDNDGLRLDCYINRWLENKGTAKFLVRIDTIHGCNEVRAILSDRYVDLSNEDIVQELLVTLPKSSDFSVRFEWTPKFMYANLVSDKTKLLANGEQIAGGIRIKNSEVGMSSAVCEMMVLRETDKSGAILPGYTGFRRTHLQTKEDFKSAFQNSVEELVEKMDAALDSVAQTQFIKLHDAEDMIIMINKMYQLDMIQIGSLKTTSEGAVLETLYDVVQLYAMAATDPGMHVERREKLQRVAGEIVFNMKRYGKWAVTEEA